MTETIQSPRPFRVNSWQGATIGDVIYAEDLVSDVFKYIRNHLQAIDEQLPVGTIRDFSGHMAALCDMERDIVGDLMKAEDQF